MFFEIGFVWNQTVRLKFSIKQPAVNEKKKDCVHLD